MLSYCTNYLMPIPDITVYINCDTRLAINLRMLNLYDTDEFIFVIKNYDYIDSPYTFMYRARTTDMDENGEILFKIPPDISKQLKPGAFYYFAVLTNAFDTRADTEYKKLTYNGNIKLEYGAQDIRVEKELADQDYEVVKARLEQTEDTAGISSDILSDLLLGINFEQCEVDKND